MNLYPMMPLNGTLAFDNLRGAWTISLEPQMVSAKVLVNQVHNELKTAADALVNFRASYEWQMLRFDFGIENILDTQYDLPLGGANLVNSTMPSMVGGSSPAWGYAVAGPERSFNTRVTLTASGHGELVFHREKYPLGFAAW